MTKMLHFYRYNWKNFGLRFYFQLEMGSFSSILKLIQPFYIPHLVHYKTPVEFLIFFIIEWKPRQHYTKPHLDKNPFF